MENTRQLEIYAALILGSFGMILQNNFESQKRGRVVSLVLKIQLFQII